VIDRLFDSLVRWLAPMLPFTCEEAWAERHCGGGTVHLELFPEIPASWRDTALETRWESIRAVRRVVNGALEIERARSASALRWTQRRASLSRTRSSLPCWHRSIWRKSA
jgi:isoleucyl-tRNA synthetase